MKAPLRILFTMLITTAMICSTLEAQSQFKQRQGKQTDPTRQSNQKKTFQRPQTLFQAQVVQGQQAVGGVGGIGGFAANTLKNEFDAAVQEHFDGKNLPGIVVLMARDGMVTYKKTIGHADVANNIKVNENHVFRLASVSKWVTALIGLRLEQQGKINLNSKTRDCMPQIPAFHTSRVVDLLSNRGGIRHYGEPTSPQSPTGWGSTIYENTTDMIPNIMLDPLKVPVGMPHYSTYSSEMAGGCFEAATGKTTPNLIRDVIGIPFGLQTLRAEDKSLNAPARVKLYKLIDKDDVSKGNTLTTGGNITYKKMGGGMEASPLDLLKLGMKFCDKKVVSNHNMNRMMKLIDSQSSYTLGCNFAVENGNRVIAKAGGQSGTSTYIWMVPDKRMVMVVMINRFKGSGASTLGRKLRKIALGTNSAGNSKPDLIVEKFERTGQTRYKNGKLEIPVRLKIKNQGKGGSKVQIVNGVRLGTKYRWTGFMQVIPPKGTRTATGVVKIPDAGKLLKGRTLTLVAMADAPIAAADTSMNPKGRLLEANEGNNTRQLKVKVPGGVNGLSSGQSPNQGQAPKRTTGSSSQIKRKSGTALRPESSPKRGSGTNRRKRIK